MYAWSILAAVATYAAAVDTDTTTATTYKGDGPTVQDSTADPVVDLMTTSVTIVPEQTVADVSRTVTISGAAATGEKFEDTDTTPTALAEPTTWTCVTVDSADKGKYECYGTVVTYLDGEEMLLAKLRLTDVLPFTEKTNANLAVERRLAGTTNAADTECERTIQIQNGVGTSETSKSEEAFCDAFGVRLNDQTTSSSAWTAVLVYKETLTDEATATTQLSTLGTAMATVKMSASAKKSPATDAFENNSTVELKAQEPEKPSDDDDKPSDDDDKPSDGGDDSGDDDKDGAATLAAAAGAAISAAAFLF